MDESDNQLHGTASERSMAMTDANTSTVSERFNDDERITRALRRAAEFARLRREMWERFRASIDAEEARPNGAPTPPGGDHRDT